MELAIAINKPLVICLMVKYFLNFIYKLKGFP